MDMSATPSTPRSQGAGGQHSPSTPRPQGAGGLQSPGTVDLSGSCHDLFNSPRAVQPPPATLSRHITLDALQTAYRAQQQHVAAATAAGTLKDIGMRSQARLAPHIVDGLAAAQKLLGQDNTGSRTHASFTAVTTPKEARYAPACVSTARMHTYSDCHVLVAYALWNVWRYMYRSSCFIGVVGAKAQNSTTRGTTR